MKVVAKSGKVYNYPNYKQKKRDKKLLKFNRKDFVYNKYDIICRRVRIKKTYIAKRIKVVFNRLEFVEFAMGDKSFNELYEKWAENGYRQELTPSVDRIDNDGDYSLDNIQFLTITDNKRKEKGKPYKKPSQISEFTPL